MSLQFAVKDTAGKFYPYAGESFSLSNANARYYFREFGFAEGLFDEEMWGTIPADDLRAACHAVLARREPDAGMAAVEVPTDGSMRVVDCEMPAGRLQEIARAFLALIEHASDGLVYWSI